jgi:ankyrin repeat protein
MLRKASYDGNVKVAQLLLEHGGNVNARDEWGHTPLHRVLVGLTDNARAHFFDTIQLLLEHGADVDALNDAQSTPLHVASEYGSAKATRLLLEHGANVHLKNDEGHTPSQVASANGHEEIAELLSEPSQNEQKM